jgi:DNA-binding response OmpR family regulator
MQSPLLSLTWREPRRPRVATRFLRYTSAAVPRLSTGSVGFDLERFSVTLRGSGVRLGRVRTLLLLALVRNADRAVTFDTLRRAAWGEECALRSNALAVHLCALRRIVREHLGYDAIESLRGCGYRFATNILRPR